MGRYRGSARNPWGAALSPDGRRLFGAFSDGIVVEWDVETAEQALVLRDAGRG